MTSSNDGSAMGGCLIMLLWSLAFWLSVAVVILWLI